MSERVHSIETLRSEFAALLGEYMRHLEPAAKTDVVAVRFEATGPDLTVFINLPASGEPYMQITYARQGESGEPVEPARGPSLFQRGRS